MDQQQMHHMWPAFFGVAMMFMVVAIVAMVIPYWQIFKKAGFAAPLSLLVFVPIANIIVLYYVAFSDWKVVPVAYPAYPPPYPPQYPLAGYPPAPPPPPQI
jgi:hypothetical protein